VLKDCNHPVIEGTKICSEGCEAPDDWQQHAKCLDHDPEIFYCEADDIPAIKTAVKICLSCPIRGFCLEKGWSDKWGIWGSFTAAERERLRKAFRIPTITREKRKVIRVIAHRL
jgi:hypothetical protein